MALVRILVDGYSLLQRIPQQERDVAMHPTSRHYRAALGFMALGMSRGGAELADMGVGLAGGFAYGAVRGTSVAANSIGRQAVAGAGRRVFMPQVNAYHLTADEAGRQLPLMLTDDVLEALAKADSRPRPPQWKLSPWAR